LPESFQLNEALLTETGQRLARQEGLFWILGGSCTGKSAVSRWISESTGMETLDMDGLIYGRFMASYTAERHPAASRWFRAKNPLEWALSLSWYEFNALNRAADAEYLDLLARDLGGQRSSEELLIDGGFSHPSVLASIIPASRIVTLAAGDEIRFSIWETDPERAPMKQSVQSVPDGQAMWQKFLYFDEMMNGTIVAESKAAGIPVVRRGEAESVERVARSVLAALGADGETRQPAFDSNPASRS